jgi:hypothetical protein
MFVISNTAEEVQKYFNERLNEIYSSREISTFYKASIKKRLNLTDSDLFNLVLLRTFLSVNILFFSLSFFLIVVEISS